MTAAVLIVLHGETLADQLQERAVSYPSLGMS